MTVRELLIHARDVLADGTSVRLDSEVLLCHVLDVNRAWLFAHPDAGVDAPGEKKFLELVDRRRLGEPVAYLTGIREFWSLPLHVTPDVLIPRPETELLVQIALDFIPTDAAWRIADLGTGSGAIALAIAAERPLCEVHATDCSPAALAVAKMNSEALAAGRLRLHLGSWLAPLGGKFQVLASNPPYVAPDDPHLELGDSRFEPRDALTPGRDAMRAIRLISQESIRYLDAGGMLAFEHGFDQGEDARKILMGLGYENVITRKDLEGLERVTAGIR